LARSLFGESWTLKLPLASAVPVPRTWLLAVLIRSTNRVRVVAPGEEGPAAAGEAVALDPGVGGGVGARVGVFVMTLR